MLRTSRRVTAGAIAVTLSGVVLAAASPAAAVNPVTTLPPGVVVTNAGTASAPEYTVEVDCTTLLGEGDYDDFLLGRAVLPLPAGATARLEVSGCTDARVTRYLDSETRVTSQFTPLDGVNAGIAQEYPFDWNDGDVIAFASAQYDLGPNMEIEVTSGNFAASVFRITTPLAIPVADPPGDLVEVLDIDLPSNAPVDMQVADDLRYRDAFNNLILGGVEGCVLTPGAHPYAETEVVIDTAGVYTFRLTSLTPESRSVNFRQPYYYLTFPFLALYSTFTPADAHAGVLGCNDDSQFDAYSNHYISSSGQLLSSTYPQFSVNLQPGTYTLVLTGTRSQIEWGAVSAPVTTDELAPAAFGEEEGATVEFWSAESQLAATGPSPVSGGMLAAGLALMALGGLVFASRRVVSRA